MVEFVTHVSRLRLLTGGPDFGEGQRQGTLDCLSSIEQAYLNDERFQSGSSLPHEVGIRRECGFVQKTWVLPFDVELHLLRFAHSNFW